MAIASALHDNYVSEINERSNDAHNRDMSIRFFIAYAATIFIACWKAVGHV
jgi:hypothetical protein